MWKRYISSNSATFCSVTWVTSMIFILLIHAGCCRIFPMRGCSDTTIHRVRPGETLEEISVQYYGSELNARLILEANYLKEKGRKLKAEQKMVIPARQRKCTGRQ